MPHISQVLNPTAIPLFYLFFVTKSMSIAQPQANSVARALPINRSKILESAVVCTLARSAGTGVKSEFLVLLPVPEQYL